MRAQGCEQAVRSSLVSFRGLVTGRRRILPRSTAMRALADLHRHLDGSLREYTTRTRQERTSGLSRLRLENGWPESAGREVGERSGETSGRMRSRPVTSPRKLTKLLRTACSQPCARTTAAILFYFHFYFGEEKKR